MEKGNMKTASCQTGVLRNVTKFISRLSHKTFDASCLLSSEMDLAKTICARNVFLAIV